MNKPYYRNEPCPLCQGRHLLNGRLCTLCKGDGFVPVRQKSLGEIVVEAAYGMLVVDITNTKSFLAAQPQSGKE